MEFLDTELEKLASGLEELTYWRQKLNEAGEAQERLQTLREASERVTGEKMQAEKDLVKLQSAFPEAISRWALGKSRKQVLEYKERIAATLSLLADCETAILLLEKGKAACGHRISKGLHAKVTIERRKAEAAEECQAKR